VEKITGRLNRTVLGTNMSNAARNGGAYANATVIVAYACLVHELQPVLLAVLTAVGLG